MKKEKIALSILGVGLIIGLNPTIAKADSQEYKTNAIYTYNNNDELISIKFREKQLPANVGGSATTMYTPKYQYQQANLTRKVSTDIYGQKYTYLMPDGYSYSNLKEHSYEVYRDMGCKINSSALKGGNFKLYSAKYTSGRNCLDSNYDAGTFTYSGVKGEWRILGYNSEGDSSVDNPAFPSDWPTWSYPNEYAWISNNGNKTTYDKEAWAPQKSRAVQGAMNLYGLTGSVSSWVDKLSLQSDPINDTPVFRGNNPDGYYRTVHSPTNPSLVRDLSLTKFEVLYGDEVIGIFTRDSSGKVAYDVKKNLASENKYKYRVTVKNSNDADMDSSQLKTQIGYAIGGTNYLSNLGDAGNWFSSDISKFELIGKKLKKNEEITLTSGEKKISNLVSATGYRATAVIDKNHFTRKNPDSTVKTNDWGQLIFNIDNGNNKAVSTQLIDTNGNVVTHAPIPGQTYKVRYNYKYEGLDRNSDFEVEFTNTIVRTLNNGSTDTFKQKLTKKMSTLVSKKTNGNVVKDGDTFYVETPYMLFETPNAQATSTITQNPLIDSNANDNSTSKSFTDTYDIKVQNVRIVPKTEMPTSFPAKLKVGIMYDVVVNVPSYLSSYETDIITQINPNTSFVDHVKAGVNKDITREITVTVDGTGSLPANVHVNKPASTTQRVWESNYNNNKASTTDNVKSDGTNGNLVVKNPENPKNGGCTLSGVNNNVNFQKTHSSLSYSGKYLNTPLYKEKNSVQNYGGFYKYNDSKDDSYATRDYNESYKIEEIQFKSKLTTDLKLGNDGWVNLKTSAGAIKAGYGYDLKIVVNYKTNAIANQPSIVQTPANPLLNQGKNLNGSTYTSSGTFVRNRNVMANVPKDVYVRTQDGMVLSASGIYGTTKAFNAREISNNINGTKVEYTLINGGKIYVDEATKDGKVDLYVYTPNVSGISGKNLCDKNNVKFEVKGSMLDDNNDHIVQ